jgi:CDP-diacylglycerol--glycerol-3-phosphate 3-phosphatidyltransferase
MQLNLPNILSLLRVVISPFFLILLVSKNNFFIQVSCYLYIIGALTDYVDGWLARKFSMETSWGVFFDPLADKILTTSAFVGFAILNIVPWVIVIIIFIRDFSTTALRIIAERHNKPVKTSYLAKLKTFIQMVFISLILILLYIKSLDGTFSLFTNVDNILNSAYILWFMVLFTGLTIWTLIEYFYQNFSVLRAFLGHFSTKY